MSKLAVPVRKKVAPRPSRIRRDPVAITSADKPRTSVRSREWEIRLAIVGITFFALAISALVIDIGEALSH